MGVRLLRHELKCGCEWAGRVSFEKDEWFRIQRSPEFQTLRVWSQLPDTMVFPSGEKATEAITLLWALLFSATSSSVAAKGRVRQLKEDTSDFGLNARLNSKL